MVRKKILSKRFSLDGWDYKKWIVGNKKTIIELAKVLAPLVLSSTFVSSNPAVVTILTVGGKAALDVIDYWATQYTA